MKRSRPDTCPPPCPAFQSHLGKDEPDFSMASIGVPMQVIGWLPTLKDLERWTHTHPTHAAMHKGVFDDMRRFDFDVRLHLDHEVVVVPAEGVETEYSHGHPHTGFPPFSPGREMTA